MRKEHERFFCFFFFLFPPHTSTQLCAASPNENERAIRSFPFPLLLLKRAATAAGRVLAPSAGALVERAACGCDLDYGAILRIAGSGIAINVLGFASSPAGLVVVDARPCGKAISALAAGS